MTNIGVLVIHGMGRQEPGFADGLRDGISSRLGASAQRLVWMPVHWAPPLEDREDRLWDWMERAMDPDGRSIPLEWTKLREFVMHNFGDAVGYQRDVHPASAGAIVHRIISDRVEELTAALADPSAPIVVMAHSLVGHMMSNYIWDRQHPGRRSQIPPLAPLPTLLAFITFGCNIPLFGLAFDKAKPIYLPGDGILRRELIDLSRWLNFVDRDDVLGWPVRPMYAKDLDAMDERQRETVQRIEDREINVGAPIASWTPASHDGYWDDDDFLDPVAEYLARVLAV